MRLVELCEPLFQYVCRLNRSARKGAPLEEAAVRADVRQLLSEMRGTAQEDPRLARNFDEVELALIYFVDAMIEESSLPFADDWAKSRLQTELKGKSGGDEDFFDLLEASLKDPTEAGTERLAVFYVCLGLGFTGFYAGQPEYLRRKMMEMSARLRPFMDRDLSSRIVPGAYEHVDTSDLIVPPARSLVGVAVALLAVAAVVIGLNWYLYTETSRGLRGSFDSIERAGPAAQAQTRAGG